MATLQEISARVNNIVQDESFTPHLTGYINEGIQRCASLVLLPALETTGTVVTIPGAVETDIPTAWNYDRNLYLVDAANTESAVKIFSSLALMQREYPQFKVLLEDGDVEAITVIGDNRLVYYRTPTTADTLSCAFYQKPTLLSAGDDVPTCLPDFLQMKLLTAYTCSEIFDLIEDGVEGIKINTQKHLAAFNSALEELSKFYRAGQSRPEPSRTTQWV